MLFHPALQNHRQGTALATPVPVLTLPRGLLLLNVGAWALFLYSSRDNLGFSFMKGWRPLAIGSLVGLALAWEAIHEISAESQAFTRDTQALNRAARQRS